MEIKVEKMKDEKMGKFDKYEVESAVETLQRATEIKKDSELMKEVAKVAKTKISSLKELRNLAHSSDSDEDEEES